MLAEGDHVITHGTYVNIGFPTPMVGIDLWRVEDGRIAEHWDALLQHNPLLRDGFGNLLTDLGRLAADGTALVFEKRHRVIADGEFVLTQSEGTVSGRPAMFYDLWRVQNGKLTEHWDVWFERPAPLPHDNGLV